MTVTTRGTTSGSGREPGGSVRACRARRCLPSRAPVGLPRRAAARLRLLPTPPPIQHHLSLRYGLRAGPRHRDHNWHAANTIDVSAYNGHFFSPRSLGLSLLAVPVFRIFAFMADRPAPGTALLTAPISILNLFTVVPVAIAAALVFARFVARLRPRSPAHRCRSSPRPPSPSARSFSPSPPSSSATPSPVASPSSASICSIAPARAPPPQSSCWPPACSLASRSSASTPPPVIAAVLCVYVAGRSFPAGRRARWRSLSPARCPASPCSAGLRRLRLRRPAPSQLRVRRRL